MLFITTLREKRNVKMTNSIGVLKGSTNKNRV